MQVGAMRPLQMWEHPLGILQNIKDKHADQPTKTRATPFRIHVLPLLIRRGYKRLILKNGSYFVRCYRAL